MHNTKTIVNDTVLKAEKTHMVFKYSYHNKEIVIETDRYFNICCYSHYITVCMTWGL